MYDDIMGIERLFAVLKLQPLRVYIPFKFLRLLYHRLTLQPWGLLIYIAPLFIYLIPSKPQNIVILSYELGSIFPYANKLLTIVSN